MKRKRIILLAAGALAVLGALGGVALANGDDSPEDAAERPEVASTVVSEERETATEENGGEDDADRPEALGDEDEDAADASEDQAEGPDVAITGDPLTKASAAALDVVQQELGQGGSVSATEIGDEESYYEIEVTLDDGSQVDVQLDESFDFVGFD